MSGAAVAVEVLRARVAGEPELQREGCGRKAAELERVPDEVRRRALQVGERRRRAQEAVSLHVAHVRRVLRSGRRVGVRSRVRRCFREAAATVARVGLVATHVDGSGQSGARLWTERILSLRGTVAAPLLLQLLQPHSEVHERPHEMSAVKSGLMLYINSSFRSY